MLLREKHRGGLSLLACTFLFLSHEDLLNAKLTSHEWLETALKVEDCVLENEARQRATQRIRFLHESDRERGQVPGASSLAGPPRANMVADESVVVGGADQLEVEFVQGLTGALSLFEISSAKLSAAQTERNLESRARRELDKVIELKAQAGSSGSRLSGASECDQQRTSRRRRAAVQIGLEAETARSSDSSVRSQPPCPCQSTTSSAAAMRTSCCCSGGSIDSSARISGAPSDGSSS